MPENASSPFVFLNQSDVEAAYALARDSEEHWEHDNPNVVELGANPIEAKAMGFLAEIAACRFYGVEWTPEVGADAGYDIKMGEWTANVKATPYFDDPWLRVMDKLNDSADVYILAAVNMSSAIVKMVGWMRVEDLKKKPLRKLRKNLPPCRVAKSADLRPCTRPAQGH